MPRSRSRSSSVSRVAAFAAHRPSRAIRTSVISMASASEMARTRAPPVLDAFHEAFAGELEERGADAAAAGPEPLGQVGFDQALVGGELAVRDGVTQGVDDRGGTAGSSNRLLPPLLPSPVTISLTMRSS